MGGGGCSGVVERARAAGAWTVKDVEVNHGRLDRGVAEEGLNGSYVSTALEEVGGEAMS